jgi:putative two-component system response regulator
MSKRQKQIILVVDDTLTNIDVVKGVLAQTYLVQAALNGKVALKIIEKHKPDLILLDILMPEMDGYEICKILKSQPETKDIPVIFLTAKSQEGDETKGLALGAVDYITKPISPAILNARVKNYLALQESKVLLERQNEIEW